MPARPQTVTVAAVLQVLLTLANLASPLFYFGRGAGVRRLLGCRAGCCWPARLRWTLDAKKVEHLAYHYRFGA